MGSIFDKSLIFYSTQCDYSRKFIGTLNKFPAVKANCNLVCIDVDRATRKRHQLFYQVQNILQRKITKVPTLIEYKNETVLMLSGEEAFKWLQYSVKQFLKTQKGVDKDGKVVPFTHNEMELITDIYTNCGESKLSDIFKKEMQSFKYINCPTKRIITPVDNNVGSVDKSDYERAVKQREQMNNIPKPSYKPNFSETCEDYNEDVDISKYRQEISITKKPFPFLPMSGNKRMENTKMVEEQMQAFLASRERDTPLIPKMDIRKINFQTGEFIE